MYIFYVEYAIYVKLDFIVDNNQKHDIFESGLKKTSVEFIVDNKQKDEIIKFIVVNKQKHEIIK